jgi:imidazolonepropionase-like amidohydrolase
MPRPLVLRCDRLFDGERFLSGPVDVHVEGGVIARIGPPSALEPPEGVVIDARGSLVMPGIVNAHVHIARGGTFEPTERISLASVVRNLRGTLAAGVTTVGDMGSTAGIMRALRAHTARSPHAGPSLVAAGPIVTAPGGYPLDWLPPLFVRLGVALPCADARAGAQAAARVAAAGMDCVKIAVMHRSYAERPLPALDVPVAGAIVAEAHRLGLRVLAHAHSRDDYAVALAAGVDALMHSSFDPLDADMIARVRDAGVPVVPTLWVFESACLGAEQRWDRDPDLRRHVAPYVRASWSRYADAYAASGAVLPAGIAGGLPKSRIPEAVRTAAANLALLADAGVPIAFGNDASYGFSLVGRPTDELAAMQRAGLDAAACLRAATSRAAALLGLKDRGVLAPGKRADLLVVDRKAETDVAALEHVRTVIAAGEVVDRAGAWAPAGVARTGAAFVRGLAGTVADAWRAR